MNTKNLTTAFVVALLVSACPSFVSAQEKKPAPAPAQRRERPTPPARDPRTPGYVEAKELPDGEVPPADADGNFIIGPTHKPARRPQCRTASPRGPCTS